MHYQKRNLACGPIADRKRNIAVRKIIHVGQPTGTTDRHSLPGMNLYAWRPAYRNIIAVGSPWRLAHRKKNVHSDLWFPENTYSCCRPVREERQAYIYTCRFSRQEFVLSSCNMLHSCQPLAVTIASWCFFFFSYSCQKSNVLNPDCIISQKPYENRSIYMTASDCIYHHHRSIKYIMHTSVP